MAISHMIISVNQDTYNNLRAEYGNIQDLSQALVEHVHNKVLPDEQIWNTGVITDKTYQLGVIIDEHEPYDEVLYTAHAEALAKELTTQYTVRKPYAMFEQMNYANQNTMHTNVTEVATHVATVQAKLGILLRNMLSVIAIFMALSILPTITRTDLNKVAIAKHVSSSQLAVWVLTVLTVIVAVYLVDKLSNLNLKTLRISVGFMALISILLLIDVMPINLTNVLIQALLISFKAMHVLLTALSLILMAQVLWFALLPSVDSKLLPETVTLLTKDSTTPYAVTFKKVDDGYIYDATVAKLSRTL